MGQGLSDIINTLFAFLPLELVIAILILLAVFVFPGWLFSVRSKQIKGLVRKRVRATEEERALLAARAIELTARKGDRLVVLARESMKMGQRDLWKMAVEDLQQMPAHTKETDELVAAISRERQPLLHPVEVIMAVNRLRSLHMYEAALERINEALPRFPQDAALLTARAEVLSSIRTASEAVITGNTTEMPGL